MELLFSTADSWPITIVRAALGVILIGHGAQKVFGWFGGYGLRKTAASFAAIGLPFAGGGALSVDSFLAR